jgi:hypothetical protein
VFLIGMKHQRGSNLLWQIILMKSVSNIGRKHGT